MYRGLTLNIYGDMMYEQSDGMSVVMVLLTEFTDDTSGTNLTLRTTYLSFRKQRMVDFITSI